MTEINQWNKEYRDFKHNWELYNYEERRIIVKDFRNRLYKLLKYITT